jgi:uncharacterized membrane protein
MSIAKRILLGLMALFYVGGGINHFLDPGFYMPMMPPYLPWHGPLVFLSGVAEVVLGIAVLIPATRRVAAWGIIALLIAIFPANLHIAFNNVPLGVAPEGLGIWNWVRLPFQAVFILWAYWYTKDQRP